MRLRKVLELGSQMAYQVGIFLFEVKNRGLKEAARNATAAAKNAAKGLMVGTGSKNPAYHQKFLP